MLNKRIIPCLLIENGKMVKTSAFDNPKYIGDPINCCKLFSDLEADEIIIIDISATKQNLIDYDLLGNIASECFIPLTYGGGIKNIDQMKSLVSLGYEKFVINSACFDTNFNLVQEAINFFGSQSILACCDIKKVDGDYKIYNYLKNDFYKFTLEEYVNKLYNINVGEIIFHFADIEGTFEGLDIDGIKKINTLSKNKNIFMGGTSSFEEIKKVLNMKVDSLGVGAMFVFSSKKRGVLINYLSEEERKLIEDL